MRRPAGQLFQSRLQKDTARWDTYQAAEHEFEERNRVCKRDFNKAMNTKLKGAVEAYRESTVPVRHFDKRGRDPALGGGGVQPSGLRGN